jgi:hypothetical protein
MSTYTNVFGGNLISPAQESYISYTLTGTLQLVWPQETAPNSNLVAQIIEISVASTQPTGSSGLILPPANMVSVGTSLIVNNLSSFTQTIFNNGSTTIANIAAGAVFLLYLTNNSTANGTWSVFQLGSAISAPSVAALAGAGLIPVGATLAQDIPTVTYNSGPVTVGASARATLLNWGAGSGAGTFNLLASVNGLGTGFYFQFKNSSSSLVTMYPAGSDNINGASSITFQPNDSAFLVTDGMGNWFTLGLGTTQPVFFNYQAINVTGLSSPIVLGTTAGTNLNRIAYKFTGTLTANTIVQLPAYAQTYWVNNATTGSFTLTFQVGYPTAAGTTQTVAQSTQEILYTDGANVINAVTASGSSLSNPVTVTQGGTGATSAPTALANLGGGSIGIAVFEANVASTAQTSIGSPSVADAAVLAQIY